VLPVVNVPFTKPEIFPGVIGFETGIGAVDVVVVSFLLQEKNRLETTAARK
jgi:hypothetical protein